MPRKAMEVLTESMFYVLLALRHEAMCGIEAAAYIRELTHGRIVLGPATLYTVLGKFEQEGHIRQVQAQGRKRTYCITGKGIDALDQEITRLGLCLADAALEGGHSHV